MGDVLDRICENKRLEIAAGKAVRPVIDLAEAVRPRVPQWEGFGVIAEVKKASPSAGAIAVDVDVVAQARSYAEAGATAVSVLTDATYFGGSLDDLAAVRAAVDVPLLRKDFIIDPWQVGEARAAGADIVLLIVAALGRTELLDLADRVRELGMTPLVEVHDPEEVDGAVAATERGGVIGVNARNLHSLDVDLDQWIRILPMLPEDRPRIAESGIKTVDDALRARAAGYDGVLCGEALMRSTDPAAFVAALKMAGQ